MRRTLSSPDFHQSPPKPNRLSISDTHNPHVPSALLFVTHSSNRTELITQRRRVRRSRRRRHSGRHGGRRQLGTAGPLLGRSDSVQYDARRLLVEARQRSRHLSGQGHTADSVHGGAQQQALSGTYTHLAAVQCATCP